MQAISFPEHPASRIDLPIACQCDCCKKQNVESFRLWQIKNQIQLLGVASFRRRSLMDQSIRRAA